MSCQILVVLAAAVALASCRRDKDDRAPEKLNSVALSSTPAPVSDPKVDPCVIAYQEAAAMLAHAPDVAKDPSLKANGFPAITLASRETFLEGCSRFPETVRRCLVFEYAASNPEVCTAARRAYDQRQ